MRSRDDGCAGGHDAGIAHALGGRRRDEAAALQPDRAPSHGPSRRLHGTCSEFVEERNARGTARDLRHEGECCTGSSADHAMVSRLASGAHCTRASTWVDSRARDPAMRCVWYHPGEVIWKNATMTPMKIGAPAAGSSGRPSTRQVQACSRGTRHTDVSTSPIQALRCASSAGGRSVRHRPAIRRHRRWRTVRIPMPSCQPPPPPAPPDRLQAQDVEPPAAGFELVGTSVIAAQAGGPELQRLGPRG